MSGGGSRVIKGRMTSKFRCDVSAEELKGMEGRLERDSQQLEALREQHFALEDKVNQLKKTVNEMESNMEKYNAEIQVYICLSVLPSVACLSAYLSVQCLYVSAKIQEKVKSSRYIQQ
jgi:predicted nuclease with TOPRIM domain